MNLDRHTRNSPDQEVSIKQRKNQKTEYKFEGSIKPKRGHLLWEINTVTLEVKEASFIQKNDIYWFDAIKFIKSGWKREVQIKKDCIYISALNKKSALKRYKEDKGSAIQPSGGKISFW